MRNAIVIAAGLAIVAMSATAGIAQTPAPAAPSPKPAAAPKAAAGPQWEAVPKNPTLSKQTPAAKPQSDQLTGVKVVDYSELPEELKKRVGQIEAQTTAENKTKLMASIDKVPELKKALADKGATSGDVVATSKDPKGTLLLVVKKRG